MTGFLIHSVSPHCYLLQFFYCNKPIIQFLKTKKPPLRVATTLVFVYLYFLYYLLTIVSM